MNQNKTRYSVVLVLFGLILLESCHLLETNDNDECYFALPGSCSSTSYSIVDPDTYENLLGYDKPINPDSIVITNITGDTMYHTIYTFLDGWSVVSGFSPFQELYCFNICELDTAFSRFYFMYIGNGDVDTVEVQFARHIRKYHLFFNGVSGEVPGDIPEEHGSGRSQFWFLKEMLDQNEDHK